MGFAKNMKVYAEIDRDNKVIYLDTFIGILVRRETLLQKRFDSVESEDAFIDNAMKCGLALCSVDVLAQSGVPTYSYVYTKSKESSPAFTKMDDCINYLLGKETKADRKKVLSSIVNNVLGITKTCYKGHWTSSVTYEPLSDYTIKCSM